MNEHTLDTEWAQSGHNEADLLLSKNEIQGGKKRKIQGKIWGFLKPKIHGNTMEFSSNTRGKIHV